MVCLPHDDDDDDAKVLHRSVEGVVACLYVYWRVEDLLALLPTLFLGLLGQFCSDSWETCLIHLKMCQRVC